MAKLRLPARLESLGPFRLFVLGELERAGGMEELVPRVDLLLEEVLVNSIKYAYPGEIGEIEIECMAEAPGTFRLAVMDWGTPFNPLERADPDLSADIAGRRVGGLGIFFLKEMAGRLSYERRGGSNVLTLWFEKHGQSGPLP